MKETAVKRRSSRIPVIQDSKSNLKRKATAPLATDFSKRPALKNLTNQSNDVNKASGGKNVEKKIPNYLKPTFSTQQKCSQKKVETKRPQPLPTKKVSQASTVRSTETCLKPIKETTADSAPENYFDFEEETENKESETSDSNDQVSESQRKPEGLDIASPVRIEIVPIRKAIQSTPKPPVDHVLSALKSSLSSPLTKTPRVTETKLPQFFKTVTPQRATETVVDVNKFGDEPNVFFEQPPRRSYSRPRPVTNFCEFDEPDSEEEKENVKEDKNVNAKEEENVNAKEESKGKQKQWKKAKKVTQDEHFEELAAAINSEFDQVENFQLVVD